MTPELNVPLKHNTLSTINSQTAPVALLEKKKSAYAYAYAHNNTTVSALLCHSQMSTDSILPFLVQREREYMESQTHIPETYKEEQ